jgi:hypothetical protein
VSWRLHGAVHRALKFQILEAKILEAKILEAKILEAKILRFQIFEAQMGVSGEGAAHHPSRARRSLIHPAVRGVDHEQQHRHCLHEQDGSAWRL